MNHTGRNDANQSQRRRFERQLVARTESVWRSGPFAVTALALAGLLLVNCASDASEDEDLLEVANGLVAPLTITPSAASPGDSVIAVSSSTNTTRTRMFRFAGRTDVSVTGASVGGRMQATLTVPSDMLPGPVAIEMTNARGTLLARGTLTVVPGGTSTGGDTGGPVAGPPGGPGCGLSSAAFCETFDTAAPGGNGGDLDETRWAVSRWGIGYNLPQIFHRPLASTKTGYEDVATFCGATFSGIAVGNDYKVCSGIDGRGATSNQLNEVIQDGGDNIYVNSMMARQPFDFAGRTGTIAFDVDAKIFKRNDGHGWWVEVWISEDPAPLPYQRELPSVDSVVRNSVGFEFRNTNENPGCEKSKRKNGLTGVFVSNNYKFRDLTSSLNVWSAPYNCVQTEDTKLNRFEIRINTQQVEVWGSDAGVPSSFRLIARVAGLNLNFTRGYVSFQHTHYNASKSPAGSNQPGTTPTQTFRWDNLAFDGPVLPRLKAADAPLPVSVQGGASFFGTAITPAATLSIPNVVTAGATRAFLNFNVFPTLNVAYRLNGTAWHTVNDPLGNVNDWRIRSLSIPVALSELKAGTNTVEIKSAGTATANLDTISNVDLSVQ